MSNFHDVNPPSPDAETKAFVLPSPETTEKTCIVRDGLDFVTPGRNDICSAFAQLFDAADLELDDSVADVESSKGRLGKKGISIHFPDWGLGDRGEKKDALALEVELVDQMIVKAKLLEYVRGTFIYYDGTKDIFEVEDIL